MMLIVLKHKTSNEIGGIPKMTSVVLSPARCVFRAVVYDSIVFFS